MTENESSWADNFAQFIQASPTSYHAVDNAARLLKANGFRLVDERQAWDELGEKNFVIRDGAILAWIMPQTVNENTGLKIVGTHSDSPALKLKPAISFMQADQQMADVEIYGGPLLTTWVDRELAIAGRVTDFEGQTRLIQTDAALRISTLAPHLDHESATKLTVDRQKDLMPLFAGDDLTEFITEAAGISFSEIAGFDLFLVPNQAPSRLGHLFTSYRLDNLASTYPALMALSNLQPTNDLIVFAAFDHEEIGSNSPSGAAGSLLADILTRIAATIGYDVRQYLAWLQRGSCISADVTHALNPNKANYYDPRNQALLGGGPALKLNAKMRYASDANGAAIWRKACREAAVASQVFVNHNEIPGGTTIGPLIATRLGITTVDVGAPIQSMHSARELCDISDLEALAKVFKAYWAS